MSDGRTATVCGRFEIHSAIEIIARIFQLDAIDAALTQNYNIAPSQEIAIVINDGENRLVHSRWGFVPAWSKELKTGYTMINARAETVAANRTFRHAFEKQRCLVPADGFYEWDKKEKARKPHYVHLASGRPMGFAGLYTIWNPPEGASIRTCAIITTVSNELLAPLHPRMPAIVDEEDYSLWLDPARQDKDALQAVLKPCAPERLECHRVTSKVNSYKYNNPENIAPVESKAEKKGGAL